MRIEHDEGTYTFFCNLVTFSDDVKKAEVYVDSLKDKDNQQQSYDAVIPKVQRQRVEPPSAAALKKKLAGGATPESSSLSVPSQATRQASVFRKARQ